MVIFESALSYRFFSAAAYVIAGYIAIQIMGLAADNDWHLLGTSYGLWYLVELFGFFGVSCLLYAIGAREKNLKLIRWTAAWTVLGVIINRFNVSLIAFNWNLPAADRYFPSWMEIGISVFLVTLGLIAFRFIVSRMPILYEHPDYRDAHNIVWTTFFLHYTNSYYTLKTSRTY
jgi:Ni/Fe-hydrogenase subunit HybB-like protein